MRLASFFFEKSYLHPCHLLDYIHGIVLKNESKFFLAPEFLQLEEKWQEKPYKMK